jgi:pyruvate/2-oxoglutarate/acetoin dehydrogenase E1 component
MARAEIEEQARHVFHETLVQMEADAQRGILFTHVCGLKTVVPSNPNDAKGLLISAIEDPDPVIFLSRDRRRRLIARGSQGRGSRHQDGTIPLPGQWPCHDS